jgi:hypothetical protein
MPKLRHIAIAAENPFATAEFYNQAFEFTEVGPSFGVLVDDVDGTTDKLEKLGSKCFARRPEGHKGFYETKFHGPTRWCSTSPTIRDAAAPRPKASSAVHDSRAQAGHRVSAPGRK